MTARERVLGRVRSEAEIVRHALFDPEPDDVDRLEEGVFTAIRKTRSLLHIHSERIFLVGCGEGAAAAYRFGLSYPERFAGVVAVNGWLPHGFLPLARMRACRDLPILVVHGAWNTKHPLPRLDATSEPFAPEGCESRSRPILRPTA